MSGPGHDPHQAAKALVKFTLLTRDLSGFLTDRYSERKETAAKLEARVNLKAAT